MNNHLISLTVLFPLIGAISQAFVPVPRSRWIALIASLAASACAVILVASMQTQTAEMQAIESFPWVGAYAISYEMAVDGLNALLVLLIAILFPVLISAEWNQQVGVRGLHSLLLVLQTALSGAVCAQDLFLQLFFWGLSALPFYFLVGIWGGEGREKAAFRSTVAATVGNALIFIALIIVYYSIDPHGFSIRELSGGKFAGQHFHFLGYDFQVSWVAFTLISFGLALRAPVWPLHGWFIEMATEGPSTVFVALAAATVPVATYIFLRICYCLFPDVLGTASRIVLAVGAVNLIMGGVCALSQRNLRSLLAYVCLSEVGIVMMGIGSLNATGVVGSVFQQLILGLALAGFGLFSGIISDRTGRSDFLNAQGQRTLGGIAVRAPAVSVVAGVVIVSLLGFPGFGGFVGHSLVVIGSFSVHPFTLFMSGGALLLASYYLFNMYRNVFLGSPGSAVQGFQDLTLRERFYMAPVVCGLLFFGLYPKPLIELIRPTVLTLLSTVR
ncbi:MAG: NADH-quinone oxidoreductase subunit M [Bdellovibrio sp.]|nr:NADH-quinone oxidoreductase subunit M [Bdellovibrio sp.]